MRNKAMRDYQSGTRRDDSFRANARQHPRRPGMVQAEDGSWVPRSFYGRSSQRNREQTARAERAERRVLESRRRITEQAERGSRQSAIEAARSASSPGGKMITAAEMRQIMKENNGHMLQIMRGAAAGVAGSPEFFRFFDSVAAKSFNHLTDMKADAV